MHSEPIINASDRILVTGSNGFVGAKVVSTLFDYGLTNLRCFVRPNSRLERLESALKGFSGHKDVDMTVGDLLSRDDCRRAVDGVSTIYHLAAGVEKSFAAAFMNSAIATRNLIEAFLE